MRQLPLVGKGEGKMVALRPTDEHARDTDDRAIPASAQRLKRRGLIAGAAALAAGVLAARSAGEVDANTGDTLVIGNAATAPGYQNGFAMTWLAAAVGGKPGLRVTNSTASTYDDVADGVQGYATGNGPAGVYGRNDAGGRVGVHGNAAGGTAVYGQSNGGQGVTGVSGTAFGVYASGGAAAVYAGGGTFGVYAVPGAGAGAGVYATTSTNSAHAVQANVGAGTMAHGVVGSVATAGWIGVLGQAGAAGAFGLYGLAQVAGAYAGYFSGKVVVAGDFSVTGSKSAAIPHPDGTHRLVYCVEAPEAWLEDFGEGTLVGGAAEIALDPAFAAIADTGQMHVFLTPHQAEGNGLAVTKRHAAGFTVTERNRGTSGGTFSYRVVVRRKDRPGERLATVVLPPPVETVAAAERLPPPSLPPKRHTR